MHFGRRPHVRLAIPLLLLCLSWGCPSDNSVEPVDAIDSLNGLGGLTDAGGFLAPALPQYECVTNTDCYELYSDFGPCDSILCDTSEGTCVFATQPNFVSCDDNDLCTTETVCVFGDCKSGQTLTCDDDNPCTDDACDKYVGCVYTDNELPCDDGNVCTEVDECTYGKCLGSTNTCTCTEDSDCASSEDQNLCNGTLVCNESGQCVVDAETIITCPAPTEECESIACDPSTGQCKSSNSPDGTPCNDENLCTLGDECIIGTCFSKSLLDCENEVNTCVTGTCIPEIGCVFENLSGLCDDNNPCTTNDFCAEGACLGTGNTCECLETQDCAQYEDNDPCNGILICSNQTCQVDAATLIGCNPFNNSTCSIEACNPETGLCQQTPINEGGVCDDGNLCTEGQTCSQGSCSTGETPDCTDDNSCTNDGCIPETGCFHAPTTGLCDDGDSCTSDDSCKQGICTGTELPGCGVDCSNEFDCNDLDPCTDNICTEEGICSFVEIPGCACVQNSQCNDGNPCTADICENGQACINTHVTDDCDDGNSCTEGDTCSGGNCVPGTASACDDGNPCTTDSCTEEQGCVWNLVLDCSACESTINCDDANPCTGNLCVENICKQVFLSAECEDEDPCTSNDTCEGGVCQGGFATACNDLNPCTMDSCVPGVGCVTELVNEGSCQPDSACASSGECIAGECVPIVIDEACCVSDDECADALACASGVCQDGECLYYPQDCQDSNPCIISYCEEGECISTEPLGTSETTLIFEENFDDANIVGWTLSNDNQFVKWQLDSKVSYNGAFSLYAGNAENETYNYGNSVSIARTPPFYLPQGGGELRFRRYSAVEDQQCPLDGLYVAVEVVGDQYYVLDPSLCGSTGGTFSIENFNLDNYAGLPIRIWFIFDTGSAEDNDAFGIAIDDVRVLGRSPSLCCVADSDCDDANPCSNDYCITGVGCIHQSCGIDSPCNENSCILEDCAATNSCCSSPNDCDDDFACTTDNCVQGKCVYAPIQCTNENPCLTDFCYQGECYVSGPGAPEIGQTIFFESFDDGSANGWTFHSNNEDASWSISTTHTNSFPISLYGGSPATNTYDVGDLSIVAKTPILALPDDEMTLRFSLWADLAESTCTDDVFFVYISYPFSTSPTEVLSPKVCKGTGGGFDTVELPLSDYAGEIVQLAFTFSTYGPQLNNAEGIYLDDISILAFPNSECLEE